MLSQETIAIYGEVGKRMAKYANLSLGSVSNRVSNNALKAIRQKMGPKLRRGISVKPPKAPSIKGVKAPRAPANSRPGFPPAPKPPTRV